MFINNSSLRRRGQPGEVHVDTRAQGGHSQGRRFWSRWQRLCVKLCQLHTAHTAPHLTSAGDRGSRQRLHAEGPLVRVFYWL